jgi:hypothetical protein
MTDNKSFETVIKFTYEILALVTNSDFRDEY